MRKLDPKHVDPERVRELEREIDELRMDRRQTRVNRRVCCAHGQDSGAGAGGGVEGLCRLQ